MRWPNALFLAGVVWLVCLSVTMAIRASRAQNALEECRAIRVEVLP